MGSNAIRIGLIVVGIILIAFSIWMNTIKRLVVNYAVAWGLAGCLMVLVGAVPAFSSWTRFLVSGTGLVFFCAAILVLFIEIQNSVAISQLTMKNCELAMYLALLNQESEHLMAEQEKMRQEDAYEKDTVCG